MSFNICIDFGGVLSIHDAGNTEHVNTLINYPGAMKTLIELSKTNKLYINSFCGKRRAIETKESLYDSGILNYFSNCFFVKDRYKKGIICSLLNAHFMIDDNKDVLDPVKQYSPNTITILFGKQSDEILADLNGHIYAESWLDIANIIENTDFFECKSEESFNVKKYIYDI